MKNKNNVPSRAICSLQLQIANLRKKESNKKVKRNLRYCECLLEYLKPTKLGKSFEPKLFN